MHRGSEAQRRLIAAVTARIGAAGVVAHRLRPLASGDAPEDGGDGSVRAVTARSASEEHDVIARLLRERHVHDAVPWSACAVIAHDSRQVAALEAELAAREVPTRTRGQRPLAQARAVADLLRVALLAELEPTAWTRGRRRRPPRRRDGSGRDPATARRPAAVGAGR
jgi:superfamily I DNA/RNA helicase